MKKQRKKWTAADDDFIRAHAQTLTAADFAQHFGVSKTALESHCQSKEIRLRKKGWSNPTKHSVQDIMHARMLRNQGLAYKQIAEQTGIKLGYLREILSPNSSRRKDAMIGAKATPAVIPATVPATPEIKLTPVKAQPGPLSTARADRIAVIVRQTMTVPKPKRQPQAKAA